ncbi:hypothetical protein ACA910_015248 [Epithemia clementina (nom. ined.)]
MKLVYQTNQHANFPLSGSSLALVSSFDAIKEAASCSDGSPLMIEDDSSTDDETSCSVEVIRGNEAFRFARCESQKSIGSYKVLRMDGFELASDHGLLASHVRSDSITSWASDDELNTVEVAARRGSTTKELTMSDFGPSIMPRTSSLLSLLTRSLANGSSVNLYWSPERKTTPLKVSLNAVWWFWSPLLSSLTLSPSPASCVSNQRTRELRLAGCQSYLEGSSIACTSVDDGKRIVQEVLCNEIYIKASKIVEEAKFVVDIGANVGAFAAWVAAKHDAASKGTKSSSSSDDLTVLCLEPVPSTASACEVNVSRAMRKHPKADIKVAKMGLAPKKGCTSSEKIAFKPTLTYFEETPSSSATHHEYKYESSIKPLLQSEEAFLDYYRDSKPTMCKMIENLPLQGWRQAACELAVAFLWRWRPVSVKLGSLLQAFHMTKTDLPDTIDLLKVDIDVAMDFIEDWWWPKVKHVLIEEVASSTELHRDEVLNFLKQKGFLLLHEAKGTTDTAGVIANRFMILRNETN